MSDGDGTGTADGDAAVDAAGETGAVTGTGTGTDDGSDGDEDRAPARDESPSGTEPGSLIGSDREVDASAAPAPGDGLVRLDPRVQAVWLVRAVVSAVVLGTIVGVAGLFVIGDPRPGAVVGLLVVVVGSVHAVLRYRVWRYEVREESLHLERGVLTRVRTVVPYVRIQHVDASRGPVERTVGLATAVVYTAGSRGADVSIPGLSPEDAEALQYRLERLAIAAEGDDAV